MEPRPLLPGPSPRPPSPARAEPPPGRPAPLPPHLARLLRTGPFHEALRAAITASGLSLDRVRDRLGRRGTAVAAATLSAWQSGRNRPERSRSLAALAVLEEVLLVPPGALAALLGPPRARGRHPAATSAGPGLAEAWPGSHDIGSALRQVDTRWDRTLSRLSCHNRLEIDAGGRERLLRNRRLLRAERDGADRWIAVHELETPGPLPLVRTAPPCRTGRVIEVPDKGLLVAELLFDRPLARGETVIVDYALDHRLPGPRSTRLECALHVPVREYLLEVSFAPAALPATCHSFRTAALDSPAQARLLRLDAAGSVHAVALAAGPCRFGIRWTWE